MTFLKRYVTMWSSVAQQPVQTIVSEQRGYTGYSTWVLQSSPLLGGRRVMVLVIKIKIKPPTDGIFFGEENKASGSGEAVNVDVKLNNGISGNNKNEE